MNNGIEKPIVWCKAVTVPAPVPESACTGTGITVVSDPAGDQTGTPANAQLDIQSISISEKYVDASTPSRLMFTMKVGGLSSPIQPNSSWTIFFTSPNGSQYFVDMNTTGTPTTPAFEYGHTTTLASGTTQQVKDGAADAASTFSADGTITIFIDDSLIGGIQAGNTLRQYQRQDANGNRRCGNRSAGYHRQHGGRPLHPGRQHLLQEK